MGFVPENLGKYEIQDISQTDTVNAGNHDYTDLQPPEGYVYIIRGTHINCPNPVGSGADNHLVYFYRYDGTNSRLLCYVSKNFGGSVRMEASMFYGDSEEPSSAELQQKIMNGGYVILTHDSYLRIDYYNNTDVNQTGTRVYEFLVEKIRQAV